MTRRSKITGFTLVELSVAMVVGILVLGGIMLSYMALQRGYAFSIRWSEARVAQARIIDSMALDLRNALTVSTSSGSLPLVLTLPARFSAYETKGSRAGDPHSASTMASLTINRNTGKPDYGAGTITVIYEKTGAAINRRIQQPGITPDPSRTVAVFEGGVSISFRNQNGTAFTPANNTTMVVEVTTTVNSWNSSQPVSNTMTDMIFLRGKSAYSTTITR